MRNGKRWLFDLCWVAIAATGLAGCSGSELATGNRILPTHEQLTYQGIAATVDAKGVFTVTKRENPQEVEITGNAISTFVPGIGGGTIPLRADGTVDVKAQDRFVTGGTLFQYLPPAGLSLRVGKDSAYTSPAPEGVILHNYDDTNSASMYETTTSTPVEMWHTDAGWMMRVESEGIAKMFMPAPDRTIQSKEVAMLDRGVADLLLVPGGGWRVVRMFRLADAQSEQLKTMTIDDLRGLSLQQLRSFARLSDVFCLTSSDKLSRAQLTAILADSHGYSEFDLCAGGR